MAVVNPRQVRDFAKATGRRLRPIASMPRFWPISPMPCARNRVPCPTNRPILAELFAPRGQLLETHTAERHRLATVSGAVQEQIRRT